MSGLEDQPGTILCVYIALVLECTTFKDVLPVVYASPHDAS